MAGLRPFNTNARPAAGRSLNDWATGALGAAAKPSRKPWLRTWPCIVENDSGRAEKHPDWPPEKYLFQNSRFNRICLNGVTIGILINYG